MMWMILQAEKLEDWVIATGKTTTVRDFVVLAFKEVGIELEFKGSGVDEKATVSKCNNPEFQLEIGKEVLSIDPAYFRPTEVDLPDWRSYQGKRKIRLDTRIRFIIIGKRHDGM